MSAKDVRAIVEGLGDVRSVLADADPKLKAQLYNELGISVRYTPIARMATANTTVRVGGPDRAKPDWRVTTETWESR